MYHYIQLPQPSCKAAIADYASWSRNNRYLLTASLDTTCIIWDLSILPHPSLRPTTPLTVSSSASASTSSHRVATIRLDAPVATAYFHPLTTNIVLATLTCHEVVLIDRRVGGGRYVLRDVMEVETEGNVDRDEGEEAEQSSKKR